MDSDIRKRLASANKRLSQITVEKDPAPESRRPPSHRKSRPRRYILVVGITALIITIGFVAVIAIFVKDNAAPTTSVVPLSIAKSVTFPVYYPDPKKMPPGYVLVQDSFSAANQAVVYSVAYDSNKTVAFTVQAKPAENDLKVFYANQLPLRNELSVPAGTAAIGVINNQTLVSLPTNDNAWLLITAPLDIEPEHLHQLLRIIQH